MRAFVSVEVLLITVLLLSAFYPLAQGLVNSIDSIARETVNLTYIRMSLSLIKSALYKSTYLGTQYTVVTVPDTVTLRCEGDRISMTWYNYTFYINTPGLSVSCVETTLQRGSTAIRVTPNELRVIS